MQMCNSSDVNNLKRNLKTAYSYLNGSCVIEVIQGEKATSIHTYESKTQ